MGNKLGWILAAVLVVGLIVAVILTMAFPSHSRPKATMKEGMLDLQTVNVPISEIAGAEPSGEGNAADNYDEAARLAVEQKVVVAGALTAIMDAKGGPAAIDPAALEALRKIDRLVAAGTRKKKMQYLFVYTPKNLEVHIRVEELMRLYEVAGAMNALGRYYICQQKYSDADQVYRHLMVMGWHMVKERSHIHMVRMGMGFQRTAWQGMMSLSNAQGDTDKARLKTLGRYETALIVLSDFYIEKQKIIWTPQPYPGDVFNIVVNDKDRAWRVQAILTLGLIKFSAAEEGDQDYIQELLEELVDDEDPIVAAAAKAAKNLKIEEYRLVGVRM